MELKLHISAQDSCVGDGSVKKPFSSLEQARDAVREMRSSGKISKDDAVTFIIHGGEYYQEHTFVLDERDSGSENAPVVFRAQDGDEVIITGGRTLVSEKFYKPDRDAIAPIVKKYPKSAEKIVAYDLRADGVELDRNLQIYWNGNRGVLARYPNKDYHYMKGVENFPCDDDKTWIYEFDDSDKAVGGWKSFKDIVIKGNFYIDWASTEGTVIGYDYDKHKIRIECNGEARDGGRYFFSNVFDELDEIGEYYIDHDAGILYFIPEGDIKDTTVVITQCSKDVINVKANYITIEGCTIEAGCENLITADCTGFTVRGCTLRRTLKTAVRADGYNALIEHNEIYTIGADAIDMGGGDKIKLTPGNMVICDNVIHDFGEIYRVYNGAVFFRGRGITCVHNEMYRAPHLAMSMCGSELDIQYNYIHDVCYEAADAGAVYLGGWAPQDIIFSHNIIKNIVNIYNTGAPNGYYNDDGGGFKTIRANLFIDIAGNAFAMGGGRDNIIEDNIIVNSRIAYDERLYYDQWEMHNAIFRTAGLWNNLLTDPSYATKEWAIRYPRTLLIKATNVRDYNSRFVPYALGHTVVRNNVTYDKNKRREDIQPDTRRLSNFRDNIHYESLDDIGFADFENGDYRLKPESRVLHDLPGFEVCDFSLVGVR